MARTAAFLLVLLAFAAGAKADWRLIETTQYLKDADLAKTAALELAAVKGALASATRAVYGISVNVYGADTASFVKIIDFSGADTYKAYVTAFTAGITTLRPYVNKTVSFVADVKAGALPKNGTFGFVALVNSDKPAELATKRAAFIKSLTPNIVAAYGVYTGATAALATTYTNGYWLTFPEPAYGLGFEALSNGNDVVAGAKAVKALRAYNKGSTSRLTFYYTPLK